MYERSLGNVKLSTEILGNLLEKLLGNKISMHGNIDGTPCLTVILAWERLGSGPSLRPPEFLHLVFQLQGQSFLRKQKKKEKEESP